MNNSLVNIPFKNISNYPTDSTPVSFDSNGNIISYFGDDIWDFTYYTITPTTNNNIYFKNFKHISNTDLQNRIKHELKIFTYCCIYCDVQNSKDLNIQTIINSYYSYFKEIMIVCSEYNVSFSGIANNDFVFIKITNKYKEMRKSQFHQRKHIFDKLEAINTIFPHLEFNINLRQRKILDNLSKLLVQENYKQYLVIPSSIYLKIITFINKELSKFSKIQNQLFQAYESRQNFDGLENISKENQITDLPTLNRYISHISFLSIIKIIFFTGLRLSEALLLPYNCFQKVKINNNSFYILNGYTSKFTKSGAVKTSWITSSTIKDSVHILKSITNFRLRIWNINLELVNYERVPLFINNYQFSNNFRRGLYDYPLNRNLNVLKSLLYFGCELVLDQDSYIECKNTNPFEDLDKYNLVIGKNFPLTTHQFRRSLTVYAIKSKCIPISSLQAQLKHVAKEMTYYYGNNAEFAVDLFEPDLVREFKIESILNEYETFEKEVINATSPLFGIEGSRLQNSMQQPIKPLFLENRELTLKLMHEGKFRSKNTALGGCSSLEPCHKISEISIVDCIDCSHAIFSDRSRLAIKATYTNLCQQLVSYSPGEPTYNYLQFQIKKLEPLLSKISKED